MTTARLCGASITRCGDCGTAVAPSRVRQGLVCPRHPDAENVGGTCEKRLSAGTVRCPIHGGRGPQAVNRAAERGLEGEISALLEGQDVAPVNNPLRALSELLGEVTAVKDSFRDRVDELRSLTVEDQLGREDVRALLGAYERSLDRLGKLLVDASRLNLDSRIVAVEQAVAVSAARQFVDTVLPVLGLAPPELAALMRETLADRLRAFDAGRPFPPLPVPPRFVRADDVPASVHALPVAVPPPAVSGDDVEGGDASDGQAEAEGRNVPVRNGLSTSPPPADAIPVRSFLAVPKEGEDSGGVLPVRHPPNAPMSARPEDSYAAHLRPF